MGLQFSYTIFAPIYDLLLERASRGVRQRSLQRLDIQTNQQILINGIGSGLDIPWLPSGPDYHGIDITRAMLKKAQQRSASQLALYQGDAMKLPFASSQFDTIIMHLILAVVPRPSDALKEASRTLKPGGKILLLDKFLTLGKPAPLRRLVSPIMGQIATRLDVVFEEILAECPSLQLIDDQPALLGGWFRLITLQKRLD